MKYIRRLLRPRRWLRTAVLYFGHADHLSEKGKLIYYYWIGFVRSLGFDPNVEPEWTIRLKGLQIHFNPTISELTPYKAIFVNQVYQRDPGFAPSKSRIIFDVGANIGLYTVHAGRQLEGGVIYAFEPNPAAYSKLVKNIEDNHIENVRAFPYAVGAQSGRVRMRMGDRTNVGKVLEQDGGNGVRIEVEMVTLDNIVQEYSVSHIDLMKIDVEGHENEVLIGGEKALKVTKRIVMEYHGEDVLQKVRGFLRDRHFEEVLEYRGHVYFVNTQMGA